MKKWLSILIAFGLVVAFAFFMREPRIQESGSRTPLAQGTPNAPVSSPTLSENPPLPKAAKGLSDLDQHKLSLLQEILITHHDNDPRMDTELTELSEPLKKAMMDYYHEVPEEMRNDRGTVVFLLGRALKTQADVNFLRSVLLEKPCLSLQDCDKSPEAVSGEAGHLESINETTANYPQLNAVRALIDQYRAQLGKSPPDSALADSIINSLREATHAQNPRVVQEAQNAIRYLKP